MLKLYVGGGIAILVHHTRVNTLWPGDIIWCHIFSSWSTFIQTMICCLTVQTITCANVYLSSVRFCGSCLRKIWEKNYENINHWNNFEHYTLKLHLYIPGINELRFVRRHWQAICWPYTYDVRKYSASVPVIELNLYFLWKNGSDPAADISKNFI